MSNLLGMAWSLYALIVTLVSIGKYDRRASASVCPRLGAGVALAILVTLLIYLTILAPASFTQGSGYQPFTLTDDLVHIVVPLLLIGDWLIFADKGVLRWWDPLWWALIPYAYAAYALIRPVFTSAQWPGGGHYPYQFLDVEHIGWGGVAVNILVLTVVIEAIAFLMVALDRRLAVLKNRRSCAAVNG
jgi:hypothetical protein